MYTSQFRNDLQEKLIPKAPAYWISPIGRVLPLKGSEDKHIHEIIKNPKAFGLTIEQIQTFYDEEGEVLGDEGKAREKLIKSLVMDGWIRIRLYIRNDTYTVNINNLNNRNKNFIYNWAKSMAEQGKRHSSVKIDMPSRVIHTSINDIVNESLLNESNKKNRLKVIENVMNFPVWSK